jgi:UDP-N-acetylglucosamine--N-acetylmuramyl-(pentapeptide) pyrophosphoryl-undecaprenol N-acetylglucosamine transferase
MKPTIYCFVAAASGGHILPALNLAHNYQHQDPNTRIIFITSRGDLDAKVMHDNPGMEHYTLALKPVPYKLWYKLPFFAFQAASAFFKSLRILHAAKPDRVITTGSYLALPVCAAAWMLRIPIELIELNVEPGKAVAALAPLASTISICFEQAQQYFPRNKCIVRPYPLSNTIRSLTCTREQLQKELAFNATKKTILIVGGSQGSVSLNNAIQELVSAHPEAARIMQFIHQTGASDSTDWKAFYREHGITAHTFAYDPQLVRYYVAADSIITRAGSGSLHEIMYLKKQCIVIPLITSTTHHQRANAYAMQQRHPDLVQVIEQHELQKDNDLLLRAIERAY